MLRIDLGGFRAPEKAEEETLAHNCLAGFFSDRD